MTAQANEMEYFSCNLRDLPYHFAVRNKVFIERNNESYVLKAEKLPSVALLAEISRWFGGEYHLELVDEAHFLEQLAKHYHDSGVPVSELGIDLEDDDLSHIAGSLPEVSDLMASDDDAPVIRLLNALMAQAIRERASDIHIEVFEDHVSIRFRVDGILHEVMRQQRALATMLVARLKVMAGLDIAERRIPQDGRISVRVARHPVDIRLSTLPSSFGERAVLRLLDRSEGVFSLDALHMPPPVLEAYSRALQQAHGIILVTGPTGSGKTTTLYAGLNYLNQQTRNIMTIEDPVEYLLPGVAQTQVNSKVDMTFARGLRAILRQDPDVVMVGEIRDPETAKIAVQASLTGHLVLSTLHTNTAVGAITRLEDMGIEPFLLASSLRMIFSQRLVRLLCVECRQSYEPTAQERDILGLAKNAPTTIFLPVGCDACHHKGYRGRTAIFEAMWIDDTLREMIHGKSAESAMVAHVRKAFSSLEEDGRRLVLEGRTSLDELFRVTAT